MNNARVMLPSGSEYLIDSISQMSEEFGWVVVYSSEICGGELDGKLRDLYPGILIHDTLDAICGVPARAHSVCSNTAIVIDGEIIEAFHRCESVALKMMDRMGSINDFCYSHRIRHYHKLLSYWFSEIDSIKPDIVIFQTAPHLVYDYIIYEVCRHKNINTFIVEKTPIPGLIYGIKDFRDGFIELKNKFAEVLSSGSGRISLWPAAEDYIERLSGGYDSAKPIHLQYTQKWVAENQTLSLRRVKKFIYGLLRFIITGPPNDYELYRGMLPEEYKMKNRVRYLLKRVQRLLMRVDLKRYYDSLASDSMVNVPYIYFALQCQPEKSTSPLGGEFVHQYLAVKALSQILPGGWKILVKEHVSQFYGNKYIDKSKSRTFYADLAALDNVFLVPLTYNSFDLIDNAEATAVISGTVGFESVCRGKPVLTFGYNWYNGCVGVFEADTLDKLRVAISKIETGDVNVSIDNVKLFITLFQELGINGVNNVAYEEKASIDCDGSRSSLVDVLIRNYRHQENTVCRV